MSHMFGSEYDELVTRSRLGSAYDNQLSDIAEERLPVPGNDPAKLRIRPSVQRGSRRSYSRAQSFCGSAQTDT